MLPPPVLVEPQHRSMLRQSVVAFADAAGKPTRVRADRRSETGFDPAVWRKMAELGWMQLSQPEDQGGLGLGVADLAALHEELGKAALPEPMAAVNLAMTALSLGDNDALRAAKLPALQAGEALATLAWQSAPGALAAEDVRIAAQATDGGWRIDGRAIFVPNANRVDGLVVAARSVSDVGLYWVDARQAGVSIETVRVADYTPVGEVVFDGVKIAADACICMPGAGVLDQVLDRGRVIVCAEAVGVMHQTLETTLDYMRLRQQFGRPIGAFQALQHRAVDLYIQLELSRSVVMRAAQALDAGAEDASSRVAACKARCAEAGVMIAGQSVHLHGTIGFTEELNLSLLIRRAHFLSAWLGNGAAHLRRYTQLRYPQGAAA